LNNEKKKIGTFDLQVNAASEIAIYATNINTNLKAVRVAALFEEI